MCVLCAAVGVTQLLGCSGAEEDGESCVEPGPERYISVSLGDTHGCAVRESGALQCWGDDEYGKVSGAPCTEFVAAAAGREQSCGLRSNGTIECWGPPGATKAPAGDDFVAIATSTYSKHTCGLREGGAIECWGGRYEEGVYPPFPAGSYTQLIVSNDRTCGLRDDGGVTCSGESGDLPPAESRYKRIAATQRSGCGLLDDDTIECWWGTHGADPPAGPFSDLFGGNDVICALDSASKPQCFSFDPMEPSRPLIDDEPDESMSGLSVSGDGACGLRTDGTLVCWGLVPAGTPAT